MKLWPRCFACERPLTRRRVLFSFDICDNKVVVKLCATCNAKCQIDKSCERKFCRLILENCKPI